MNCVGPHILYGVHEYGSDIFGKDFRLYVSSFEILWGAKFKCVFDNNFPPLFARQEIHISVIIHDIFIRDGHSNTKKHFITIILITLYYI